jgi:protoheme IX farnesyltransferase
MSDSVALTGSASSAPTFQEAGVRDYLSLLKPRVMSLVVFTGWAGLWIAPGFDRLHPFLAFVAILCLALGAGASGAINMWYDRDIDARMRRTCMRPLPAGRMAPDNALAFALILSLFSIMTMGLALNAMAAGLLAFASFFYAAVYTMGLKRRTPENIVIGGAAGAFPPVIGWAAVTGEVSALALCLFAIIFLWTPPHFWALSLFSNEDYRRAGIPMMPVVKGPFATRLRMLAYTVALLPAALGPWIMGGTGGVYALTAGVLSLFFIFIAARLLAERDPTRMTAQARRMFGYSIFYLFALFGALMIDARP